jgi:hypothetical protein
MQLQALVYTSETRSVLCTACNTSSIATIARYEQEHAYYYLQAVIATMLVVYCCVQTAAVCYYCISYMFTEKSV